MKTVYLLNGQGSQYYHMGQSFYKKNLFFRNTLNNLNNKVKKLFNISVLENIMDDSKKINTPFEDLTLSNLGIFFIQYGLFKVLEKEDILPDILVGVSFGECSCAIISKKISLEDGLKTIVTQSEFLKNATNSGYLININKDPKQSILKISNSEFAGKFSLGNYLVSIEKFEKAQKIVDYASFVNKTAIILPVKIPFHSRLIDDLNEEYLKIVKQNCIQYSSSEYEIYSSGRLKTDSNFSDQSIWDMIRDPINFEEVISILERNSCRYIELGATNTLANSVRNIISDVSTSEVYELMGAFINTQRVIKNLSKE